MILLASLILSLYFAFVNSKRAKCKRAKFYISAYYKKRKSEEFSRTLRIINNALKYSARIIQLVHQI